MTTITERHQYIETQQVPTPLFLITPDETMTPLLDGNTLGLLFSRLWECQRQNAILHLGLHVFRLPLVSASNP